jgi:hypothetical protein
MISCFKEFWLVFPRGYDYLSREFKRTSLEEELKKQKQAVAEKASIEKDRKELIETFFSKSIDTLPTSDDTVLEFKKANQSLDTFEKYVASASASQIPIKKGKAVLGFFMVFLAFCFVAAEKKEQNGKVVTQSKTVNQNAGINDNGSKEIPGGMNPYYKSGFDIGYGKMGNGQRISLLPFAVEQEVLIAMENRFRDALFKLEMDMLTAKREYEQFKSPQHEARYQSKRGMFEGYQKGAQDCGFKL